MSRYGKFDDFCRDTGNSWSTLPGTMEKHVLPMSATLTNYRQYAMYVAMSLRGCARARR